MSDFDSPLSTGPKCCPWRTTLQLPLLLAAAAGMGIAGQQVWSHRGDWQATLHSFSGGSCSGSTSACPLSTGGCASAALVADGCASSMEATDEPGVVSALAPENVEPAANGELQTL